MEAEGTHLQAYPQSSLAFHWPRLDRDQLLCIRLMDHCCGGGHNGNGRRKVSSVNNVTSVGCTDNVSNWSGGFPIENVDSFHVTVRHPVIKFSRV
jgi:vacuolar protein sorting-associated protein 13D